MNRARRLSLRCGQAVVTLALLPDVRYAWADAVVASSTGSTANDAPPLAYFLRGVGPAAKPVLHLGWVLAAGCCFVCIVQQRQCRLDRYRLRRHAREVVRRSGGSRDTGARNSDISRRDNEASEYRVRASRRIRPMCKIGHNSDREHRGEQRSR